MHCYSVKYVESRYCTVILLSAYRASNALVFSKVGTYSRDQVVQCYSVKCITTQRASNALSFCKVQVMHCFSVQANMLAKNMETIIL